MVDVTQEKQQQHSAGAAHWGKPPLLTGAASQLLQDNSVSSSALKEQDYLGMSEVSSPELRRSNVVDLRHLQLETELRLGTRLGDPENEGTALSLGFLRTAPEQPCKGTKRVYGEAFGSSVRFNSPRTSSSENDKQPEARAPVVGWPPVQSFRKQSLGVSAHQQQPKKQVQHKPVSSTSLVKAYMDGVSIGRKVDINLLDSYERLSGSLEDMFSYHICDVKLSGSDYVLTYEDKDGDLMLVGDVPWNMFKAAVKRLRIMKGSEAIGLVK